jgi:hypothetical protein
LYDSKNSFCSSIEYYALCKENDKTQKEIKVLTGLIKDDLISDITHTEDSEGNIACDLPDHYNHHLQPE